MGNASNGKIDKRVRKTEEAISNALIHLLAHKEIGNITIRELTEEADIHRATFYDHYQDIFFCYKALQDRVLDELKAVLESSPERDYRLIYSNVLNFVQEREDILSILMGEHGDMGFELRFMRAIEENYLSNIHAEYPEIKRSDSWDYLGAYHTYGDYGMISRWVQNKCTLKKEKLLDLLTGTDNLLDEMYQ